MHKSKIWYRKELLKTTAKALGKRNFYCQVVEDRKKAIEAIIKLVPKKAIVGCGGSVSLNELGLKDSLKRHGNKLLDPFAPNLNKDSSVSMRRDILRSDVFITSANAISQTGIIVNIDGTGNRVAASIFGPQSVIYIVGYNKITPDLESALFRAKNVAGPINAQRLGVDTPCAKNGKCVECDSPDRICRVTTIFEYAPKRTITNVILVNEEFGF